MAENDASDADLLRSGDPVAFGELVSRHGDRLWAVALRTLGDREEAADAVQDAWIAAFRRAGSYRGDAAVTTWLHRIVVNACLDRVRRARVRPALPLVTDGPGADPADPTDAFAARDTALDVREALATLPVDQRLALVLVNIQDLPVTEAAAVLDVPVGTVKSRCARGRARLAALLTDPAEGRNQEPADRVGPSAVRRPEPDRVPRPDQGGRDG